MAEIRFLACSGMGWRGSAKHWARYQMAYLLLGGLATPLVVSVHTVVSFDFAISLLPGWHTTIFPPYFVAGAIYSGFAMVVTLAIPARKWFHLEDLITMRHLDCMGKLMLGTGLIVAYGYMMEAFMSWYSGNPHEMFMYMTRATGPYRYFFWSLILCNILIPAIAVVGESQAKHPAALFCIYRGEHRHVAGALYYRRHQPGARLSAVFLGHVLSDAMGLGGVRRNSWILPGVDDFVRARAPVHLDLRGTRGPTPSGAQRY